MMYQKVFPQTAGFYWCKPSLLVDPQLVFIRQNMTQAEVIAELSNEYQNAKYYDWCPHNPNPFTDAATEYLAANPDARVTMLEWNIKESCVSVIQVTHFDGRLKTFGVNESTNLSIPTP